MLVLKKRPEGTLKRRKIRNVEIKDYHEGARRTTLPGAYLKRLNAEELNILRYVL